MNSAGRSPGNWGPPSFFSRKGSPVRAHLLTTASAQTPYPSPRRKRQGSSIPLCLLFPQSQRLCGSPFAAVVCLAASCAHLRAKSRRSAAVALRNTPAGVVRGELRLLRQPPDNATAPASAAVIVCAIEKIALLQLPLFFQPPAQTCHRQPCRRDGRAFCSSIFSFTKEKQKKETR